MESRDTLDLIILTKNAGTIFKEVLDKISKQKISQSIKYYIVDSNSSDNTVNLAREFGYTIKIIDQNKFHHALTKKMIMLETDSDYIVFLSQDAIPFNENWLQKLVDPMRNNKLVAGSYSRQIPKKNLEDIWDYILWNNYPSLNSVDFKPKNKNNIVASDVFFSNVSSCYKREIITKFPIPSFAYNAEDQFWARIVIENGYQIAYVPDSIITHYHDDGLIRFIKKFFDHGLMSRFFLSGIQKEKDIKMLNFFNYLKNYHSGNFKDKSREVFGYIFKYLGYFLGKNSFLLPYKIKKILSSLPKTWNKEDLSAAKSFGVQYSLLDKA